MHHACLGAEVLVIVIVIVRGGGLFYILILTKMWRTGAPVSTSTSTRISITIH